MKRYINILLLAMIISALMVSCADSYLGIEQVVTDTNPPQKVTVREVIPRSGALEIHFALPPGNPNIDQIVATYINTRGEEVEFKVSRYSAAILVEGFTGTNEKTVELKCIDSSGNESEVTVVRDAPLLSPVEIAFETMNVEPTFGGVLVEWQNKEAQPFAIHVLTEDELQVGVISLVEDPTKTIYNRDSTNTFAYVRHYPPVEQRFGFVISDKWGNRTDTLLNHITPHQEEFIDNVPTTPVTFFNPTAFAGARDWDIYGFNPTTGIQNDGNTHNATSFAPATLFNGNKTTNNYYAYKFVKDLANPDPASRETIHDVYVTFDLRRDVQLSRLVLFPRIGAFYLYAGSSPKRFRIWGTDDNNNERWSKFPEGWTLIGEYEGPEPADGENITQEEREYFDQNQEYMIVDDNVHPDAQSHVSFRYMRVQWMETYNPSSPNYAINELDLYGNILRHY